MAAVIYENLSDFMGLAARQEDCKSISELDFYRGRVNDSAKIKDIYLPAFDYPGCYQWILEFAHPFQYDGDNHQPNIDLLLLDSVGEIIWLGDIDAAFEAYRLVVRVDYIGKGNYIVDGMQYQQRHGDLKLVIEAFDTGGRWIDYQLRVEPYHK